MKGDRFKDSGFRFQEGKVPNICEPSEADGIANSEEPFFRNKVALSRPEESGGAGEICHPYGALGF